LEEGEIEGKDAVGLGVEAFFEEEGDLSAAFGSVEIGGVGVVVDGSADGADVEEEDGGEEPAGGAEAEASGGGGEGEDGIEEGGVGPSGADRAPRFGLGAGEGGGDPDGEMEGGVESGGEAEGEAEDGPGDTAAMVEAVRGEDAEGEAGFVEVAGGGAEQIVNRDVEQYGLDDGDAEGEEKTEGEGGDPEPDVAGARGEEGEEERGEAAISKNFDEFAVEGVAGDLMKPAQDVRHEEGEEVGGGEEVFIEAGERETLAGDEGEGVGDGEELEGTQEEGAQATDGEADEGSTAGAKEPEGGDEEEAVERDLREAGQERQRDGETGQGGFAEAAGGGVAGSEEKNEGEPDGGGHHGLMAFVAGEEAGGEETEPGEEGRRLVEVEMAAKEIAEQAGQSVVEEDEAVITEGIREEAEDDQARRIEGLKLGIGEGVLAELDVGIPGREGGREEFGGETGLVGVATAEEANGEI